MEYGFLGRAGKFLQEQKKHRRWMMMFLCLAGGVTLGTLTFLKLYGQAMTHKVKVLECQYEVHEHTDDCYAENEDGVKSLVCGYADYVVHVHNDDCYNTKGELVCTLEEHMLHEHTDDCYGRDEILVCREPESEGTPVPEEPAEPEAPVQSEPEQQEPSAEPVKTVETTTVQICEKEEHTHGDGCYSESQTCGLNEHTHGDGCYSEEQVCGMDEHSHDDSCYDEEGGLVCSVEEHTHDGGCMQTELTCSEAEHAHTGDCLSSELTCSAEEHTHEDACYEQQTIETISEPEPVESAPVEEPAAEEPVPEVPQEVSEGHTHTDECYEVEEGLICGEQELHIHDDSCYSEDCFDGDGNLIDGSRVSCGLLQLEEHVHSEECFKIVELTPEEVAALNGGAALHVHSEECYDEEGNLICGHEVTHIHGLECYDEDDNLICGFGMDAEHEHSAECYDEEGNLICGYEDAQDHEHDAGCYDEEGNLTCGFEDAKDHEHDAACYAEDGSLTCGYRGAKNHEHSLGCYDEDGNLICGYEGVRNHEHAAKCYNIYGELICGYEGAVDHVHTEECYDEDGNLICGYDVRESYEQSKTFECADYVVVARYNNDANIPEEAEFLAEQITPDSDGEHYINRETEYKEMMGDEEASMKALLKIGFYVEENGEKKEIEPETSVAIAVQFLDEDGLAEDSPITIVHFAEEHTEKLDGSDAKDNSTTFTMDSFSEVAIGYGTTGTEQEAGLPLLLFEDFEYEASPFLITFHIQGEAKDMSGEPVIVGASKAPEPSDEVPEPDTEETEKEGGAATPEEDKENSEDEADVPGEDAAESEEGTVDDEENSDLDSGFGNAEDSAEGNEVQEEQKLAFKVESLEQNAEIKEALADYLGESDGTVTQRVLHTLSYTLFYGDTEIDLSECTVTAEIRLGSASAGEGDASSEDEDGEVSAEDWMDDAVDEEVTNDITTDNEDVILNVPSGSEDVSADEMSDDITAEETSDEGEIGTEGAVAAYLESTDLSSSEAADVDVNVMVLGVSDDYHVSRLGIMTLNHENQNSEVAVTMNSDTIVLADQSMANPIFTVQYYAYAQIMEDQNPGGVEEIKIIDTCLEEGVEGRAELPQNGKTPKTRNMYVKYTGQNKDYGDQTGNGKRYWEIYEPVYKKRDLENDPDCTDSLTKLYTSDVYEYREIASGLDHVNKFAKAGLNFDLYEVWVLLDPAKADSTTKDGWKVYHGEEEISKLQFFNNNQTDGSDGAIVITNDTVIRLVGKSNTNDHNYPARFFDYDFTNGTDAHTLQGINNPVNYAKDASGNVVTPRFGFGNNSSDGTTGLVNDTLNGHYINRAKDGARSIIQKCSYGLVETSLSADGYPQIKANAPDLFRPQNPTSMVIGKTEIPGYSLDFKRDGDTYTLVSVEGSGGHAQNLNLFQKGVSAWYPSALDVKNPDQIWTNQFWPMDNASTFGDTKNGHDPKFGTQAQKTEMGLAVADDGREHNSFFGMTFEVEFELTEDYVGPLNYYFFGDDDMWVFLEHPDGTTELICDIGGVHQAAGEYVDLWNYIQKPQDGERTARPSADTEEGTQPTEKYSLKFFYTERGASGSTCWMQFTLPSVNAVPVIDYTGNVKSTLKLNKTVEGEPTDQRFDFTIEFQGNAGNIAYNNYPYEIRDKEDNIVKSGEIRSGDTFQLGNEEYIQVFNLPDETHYIIKEKNYEGYDPDLGEGSNGGSIGVIEGNKTVTGNIDWDRDDVLNYINREIPYNLPETGGSGEIWYMLASVIFLSLGAGLIYRKKFSERRV